MVSLVAGFHLEPAVVGQVVGLVAVVAEQAVVGLQRVVEQAAAAGTVVAELVVVVAAADRSFGPQADMQQIFAERADPGLVVFLAAL